MTRTFKVVGLSLAAVLAFSAVLATTASAATKFTATEAATLSVSSNETQVFTYVKGGAQVKCTGVSADNAEINGTQRNPSPDCRHTAAVPGRWELRLTLP